MKEFIPIFLIHCIPYVITTVFFYILFYILLKQSFKNRKIQKKEVETKLIKHEIKNSLLSILLFSVFIFIIFYSPLITYSKIYTKISDYSIGYFIATIAVMLIAQDTWFYWAHRLMHHKFIFKYIHLVHHKSTNPTPFAAYSFHPIEALFESLIFYIVLFIIPIHPLALTIAVYLSLLINAYGHLGYEIFPKSIRRTLLFKIINSSVYHNMHHKNFKGNYGLYFRFWDRIMGTEFKDYEDKFDHVVQDKE